MSTVIGKSEGIAHGTLKGYKQHRYRKVESCEPCLKAVREDYARRKAVRTTPRVRKPQAAAVAPEPAPWGLVHGDTAREPALTYIPYRDAEGQEAERREQLAAALCVAGRARDVADCKELLDMLGLLAVVENSPEGAR
ncbi:hypothetical protein Ssi03_25650 [Sphaerisporangium siamense]|uniref:Uncharacterized protein n=1 Tax=Sphaerisporangium siamense TaxID=795645 RepID=A0A7W7D4E3_9ACTN|nr:hypothetical protein [Sphaerisporangium siamense]MBB4700109.1 hypothetical protein [Sphaerisporangium siamense]GII84575.1 hypothetical protein Ssi03_25650 [Sphaerisporangium siamense]